MSRRRLVLRGAEWLGAGVLGGAAGYALRQTPAAPPVPAGGEGVFDVRRFGARGDGRHDDTRAVQAALDAAGEVRGTVWFPPGVFRVAGLVLPSSVSLRGQGMGQSVLKLLDGSTADVLITRDFARLTGRNSNGGVAGVTLADLTLDGNRERAPHGGYGLRRYGYRWTIQNVEVRHAAAGGIYTENGLVLARNADGDMMEDSWLNVRVHDNGGDGVLHRGPHDSRLVNLLLYANGGHGLRVEYDARRGYGGAGLMLQNFHAYWNGGFGLDCQGTVFGNLVESESNALGGVRVAVSTCALIGLLLYSNGTANGTRAPGLVVGTPEVAVASGYYTGLVTNNSAAQVVLAHDGGYNTGTLAVGYWVSGASFVEGTPHPTSTWAFPHASPA
ncbi:MAG: glycoside hydrolase family 55 protein [Actinomycetia bacterium]|nr:glycoside hydrolase family 55 protein [Actinomycetes bacterium]